MEKAFLLICVIMLGLIVLFYACKKGLLQKVVIKKFTTYNEALGFLKKATAGKKSLWQISSNCCNPVILVETRLIGKFKFREITDKWILIRHKNKLEWLVTNNRSFIENKIQNSSGTFIWFTPDYKNF